jgi:hypothetical protein
MPVQLSERPILYHAPSNPNLLTQDLEEFSDPSLYDQNDPYLRALKREIVETLNSVAPEAPPPNSEDDQS